MSFRNVPGLDPPRPFYEVLRPPSPSYLPTLPFHFPPPPLKMYTAKPVIFNNSEDTTLTEGQLNALELNNPRENEWSLSRRPDALGYEFMFQKTVLTRKFSRGFFSGGGDEHLYSVIVRMPPRHEPFPE